MSRDYSRTLNNFSSEERIRGIVQEELQDFFSAIKTEIELKIKQIDKSILEIRSDLNEIIREKTTNPLQEVYERVELIENMIADLRKEKQKDLEKIHETIRNKSQEKDKTNLFKKTTSAPNLDAILFGGKEILTNNKA